MSGAGRDRSTGMVRHRVLLDVPCRVDEVAVSRHAVAGFLTDCNVPSVVVDDIELVASELITNAIIHPPVSPSDVVHVEVEVSDVVRIAVSNAGSTEEIPAVEQWQPAPPLAISGRGLGIVRRLCDVVSVTQISDRAVVSCQRRLPDGGLQQ
jgi:anti-sigma regulatory factor (Ser/Thr protein kinase)